MEQCVSGHSLNPLGGWSGWTPLHEAAINGHVEVCRLILENIEEKNPNDNYGRTPLHLVAKFGRRGSVDVCRLLLENVRDKSPRDNDGDTPLHKAARNGNFELCRLLVKNVDEKSPKNNDGETPLDLAKKSNSTSCHFLFNILSSK